jgi:hypothetical protein
MLNIIFLVDVYTDCVFLLLRTPNTSMDMVITKNKTTIITTTTMATMTKKMKCLKCANASMKIH